MEKQEYKEKEKLIASELKNNKMYQYLDKHTHVSVKEIKLHILHFHEIEKLYLVGPELQLNIAIEHVRNYDPQHTVVLLQNTSGIHIFDSKYSEILDTDTLYESYGNAAKVSIKPDYVSTKQMKEKIKEEISDDINRKKTLQEL